MQPTRATIDVNQCASVSLTGTVDTWSSSNTKALNTCIWYGRVGWEHKDTTKTFRTLRQLARTAARRRGEDHKLGLFHKRDHVGAALARRSAAMLLACVPGPDNR